MICRVVQLKLYPLMNRKRFDAELTHDGLTVSLENKTRGEIKEVLGDMINHAFDSLRNS